MALAWSSKASPVTYSASAKLMHWFIAAAVIVLLALGPVMKRLVPEGLLSGVRILSLGTFVAGNICPLLLAELGANVVKVCTTSTTSSNGSRFSAPPDASRSVITDTSTGRGGCRHHRQAVTHGCNVPARTRNEARMRTPARSTTDRLVVQRAPGISNARRRLAGEPIRAHNARSLRHGHSRHEHNRPNIKIMKTKNNEKLIAVIGATGQRGANYLAPDFVHRLK